MNRFLPAFLTLVAASLVLLLVFAVPSTAGDDEKSSDPLEKVARVLKGAPLKLADAVTKAEAHTGGRAFAAQVEVEDGVTLYEVLLFVSGDKPRIVEAEVHATSGKILEVDVEYPKGHDDDDDDEDDDDDDDDDDEDDDDDDDDDEDDD